MEIERKFIVTEKPKDLEHYDYVTIEQGYLSATSPVVRIRKRNEDYILTYKGNPGVDIPDNVCVCREEEMPLTKDVYEHLKKKIDGRLIKKKRYLIPYRTYTIEFDVFEGEYEGILLAEVEFASIQEAKKFTPPEWFGEDVSANPKYRNKNLAIC